jgi:glycosyltransferase involved in cell wall biosynthesis
VPPRAHPAPHAARMTTRHQLIAAPTMRILILTEYLPISDRGEITGGVEAYCHYVGRHLREAGHDVQFISRPTDGSVWEHASALSIPKRLWFLVRALVRGFRANVDVVVGTTYVVHPVAWIVAKVRRRPVVFWYPDVLIGTWRSGQFGRAAGTIGEIAERLLLKLPVDRYIAISESTAAKLEAQGIPRHRIAVVPCGFDPELLAGIDGETTGRRRIATVSRLVGYKRTDVVIRAFARLAATRPDLDLVVIGQGPEHERLAALAETLGVGDRVELRGFVAEHAKVLSMVAGATAFVSASEIEGFGIVLVEAMALGVPYVAADIPAFREVTSGGTGGALFHPGDDEDLARELAVLLDDPAIHRERAVAGARHAARYEWADIAVATARELAATDAEHARG